MDKKEMEKKAQEFINSLSPEQMKDLTDTFKGAIDKVLNEAVKELERLKDRKLEIDSELDNIQAEIKKSNYDRDIYLKQEGLYVEKSLNEKKFRNQQNVVKCLSNGGIVIELRDEFDFVYKNVPDFRDIDSSEFVFDEDNVLEIETPKFVPEIEHKTFASKGYLLDAIRVTEDSYLIAINGYTNKDKKSNFFAILTLDQLVLAIDYYYSKAKALNKQEAERKNKRSEEYYDRQPEEARRKILFQKGYYRVLPAKVKKKITEDEWEMLDLEGREKLHKPYARYGAKRLVSKLQEGYMWASFHDMYTDLINKEAYLLDKNGGKFERGRPYANPIVSKYWKEFREMINYKLIDIKIQRQDYSESYKQAVETSFGESNTSDIYLEEYGILVKRQNGDPINTVEAELIRQSWVKIQNAFGNLKENALKYNLKISHSGKRLIFASKALGMYVPMMGTIAVSNKLGENQFESTFSHETAHFIDNFVGKLNGKRYATDNYESLAGRIAFTFRNLMNKPKSEQTEYINSTKECFARCMQEYYGYIIYGEKATIENHDAKLGDFGISIYAHPNFVSLDKFKSELIPLIEEFFKSNLDVFETTFDIDGSNDLAPVTEGEKEIEKPKKEESISDIIDALELIGESDLADALRLLE